MADNNVLVIKKDVPTSCFLSQVYDPDTDGSSASAVGKYILQPASVVFGDNGVVYYVVSVSETGKHTLSPAKYIVTDDKNDISIVSYGNDMYFLLYDDRVRPTELRVDKKLVILGSVIEEYRLVRTRKDGTTEVLSVYIDADGIIRGDRIPMSGTGSYKSATDCHTLATLEEGELVTMQLFDNRGIQCASLDISVRRAVLENDMGNYTNPIVAFDAECLQMKGTDFFIYTKQDPSHLNILPYAIHADGTRQDLPVDNLKTFIHGLEDFKAQYPGYTQPLVVKYHLNVREGAQGYSLVNGKRVLTAVKNLTVVENNTTFNLKVSIVPIWDSKGQKWTFEYFAYTDQRDRCFVVTDLVKVTSVFNPTLYGRVQKLDIELNAQSLFNTEHEMVHTQTYYITLMHGSQYSRYTIKDSASDELVFGVEASTKRRPIVCYDDDIQKYFIPTTIFENKTDFLGNFYYAARPMFHPLVETGPVAPTHFTVRDAHTGTMLITTPIPVTQYGQAWNALVTGSADQLVNGSVVVEFLSQVKEGEYLLLYGVPVDVYLSKALNRGGYNTVANVLTYP